MGSQQSLTSGQKSILEYQNAIVALQSGHFKALNNLVDKYSPTEKAYKDKLWAIFKSAATQLRLNAHIDEVINTENDSTGES